MTLVPQNKTTVNVDATLTTGNAGNTPTTDNVRSLPTTESAGVTPVVVNIEATPTTGEIGVTPTAGDTSSTFTLLPPGSTLPSESNCASRVVRSSFEPRPDNYTANNSVPTSDQIAALQPWTPAIGMDIHSDSLRQQITGNFTGTTDEILQWTACKWGIDENIVKAEAVVESTWYQSQQGDNTTDQSVCPPDTWNGTSCNQSYGILQVKYTDWESTWPMSRDDTAFNAEFAYGWIRNCYEGWADYLYKSSTNYHAGDIWGCIGFWYSGGWYDPGAITYIAKVKSAYQSQLWLKPGF